MKKLLVVLIFFISSLLYSQVVRFASIGDYGLYTDTNEANVSELVINWNPDFIITLGDNNYEYGYASTIDGNIGRYYSDYIFPYTGNYRDTATTNKFFPCIGNHDITDTSFSQYAKAYRDYFTLDTTTSGNERYYDYVKGNIHFFVINSDDAGEHRWIAEPHGLDSGSTQAQWLKTQLAASSSRWNIVYFHHPPYNSLGHFPPYTNSIPYDTLYQRFRWPFQNWGADIVLNGHMHLYDRQNVNNFTYIINGCGGKFSAWWDDLNSTDTSEQGRHGQPIFLANSRAGFVNNFGAEFVESYNDSVIFKFINTNNVVLDKYILLQPKTISLRCFIEGFYNSTTNLMVSDTVRVKLRKKYYPYNIVDSAKSVLNNSGNGIFTFANAIYDTNYYIVVTHRNSIETWSKNPVKFTNEVNYDFTKLDTMAYGNNMIQIDTSPVTYGVYGGDVNQDGIVDSVDYSLIDDDVNNFVSGYVITDVSGDNYIDIVDLTITDNNAVNFVAVIKP